METTVTRGGDDGVQRQHQRSGRAVRPDGPALDRPRVGPFLPEEQRSFLVLNKGILNAIWGRHQNVVDDIDAFLSSAAERFAGPCAVAVTDANVIYLHSDRNAVIRNDAALPVVTGSGAESAAAAAAADPSLDQSVFADPYCPTARLQPPPDHRGDYPHMRCPTSTS